MRKVIRNIIIIMIAILLLSCNPCKRLARKCPPEIKIEYRDSIVMKYDTVIRDSVIEIKLPGDTVTITKYLRVSANVLLQLDTIIVERGIVGAKAWIRDNELGVIAYVTDSTLYYQLDSARIEIRSLKEKYSSKEEVRETHIRENTGFGKFAIWWFIITAIIILFYIAYKIKEKIYNR